MTPTKRQMLERKLKTMIKQVLSEEKIDPTMWKNEKTEKMCSDLANHAFREIHNYTRQFGQDNSAYAQQFMIERLSEMINEQV